jgi:glutaredoxin
MSNRYTVFTAVKCQWCVKVIKFLATNGYEFDVVSIKGNPEALALLASKGLNTVPQVFLNKELIGGYEDTVKHFKKKQKQEPKTEA